MRRCWAVDIEGSGKSPPEIIELAIVEMRDLELTGIRKHWQFKPKNGISPIASRIHGIWEQDVADAPEIDDVADDITEWLEGFAIVGHNVRVEVDLLRTALPEWSPTEAIDTLRIARKLMPERPKHGLEGLGNDLGLSSRAGELTSSTSHSAPFDAVLTALLLKHLLAPLDETARENILKDADILRQEQARLL